MQGVQRPQAAPTLRDPLSGTRKLNNVCVYIYIYINYNMIYYNVYKVIVYNSIVSCNIRQLPMCLLTVS